MSARTRGICGRTGKVKFSEIAAKLALAEARNRDRDEKRAYRCEHCRKWHLTSWTSEANR